MVSWSLDNKYVMSGSDEMNIRVWKAHASEKLGVVGYFDLSITITTSSRRWFKISLSVDLIHVFYVVVKTKGKGSS